MNVQANGQFAFVPNFPLALKITYSMYTTPQRDEGQTKICDSCSFLQHLPHLHKHIVPNG